MKASKLRQSILQMAVQGKLVPQDLHDEPASELLDRIRKEKIQLIKEGKIKKEKTLSPITEDEIPYDLPEGWLWCKLGDICIKLTDGTHARPRYVDLGVPFLSVKDISSGKICFSSAKYITKEDHEELYKRCNPEKGDILLTKVGTTGIPVIVDTDREFSLFVSVALLKVSHRNTDNKYLEYLIRSPLVYQQAKENTRGVGNKNWVLTAIANTVIALPPLAEQQRIVAKVDELMVLCDKLEAAENELETLENNFIDYLPKSILQIAVQGKLVKQATQDEPAEALLEQIRKEKVWLAKEGKVKKEKPLPPITEDEILYDLPEGWVWCRLGSLLHDNIGGGTPSKQNPSYWNGDINWASVKDLNCDVLTTTIDTITELGLAESSSNLISEGNIIVCTRMGLGKIVVNAIPVAINQDLRALIMPKDKINLTYFIYWYKTLSIIGGGMTVKGIKNEDLVKIPFPLPSLAEQQRIVAKVDELMSFCNELKEARNAPVLHSSVSPVIPFPKVQAEESLLMVAQGVPSQEQSQELRQAIDDLFGDDEDD